MSRPGLLVLLLLAWPSLAARPTFAGVLKKFPPVSVPFTLSRAPENKVKLTAAEAEALGLSNSPSPLQAWKRPALKGQKKTLWAVGTVARGTSQLLAVGAEDTGTQYQRQETFLLSYDSAGTLLGGVRFHGVDGPPDGGVSEVSSLNSMGVVSRLSTQPVEVKEPGLPERMTVKSEYRAKFTSSGALEEMGPSYSTRAGKFVDAASGDTLWIFEGPRVFLKDAPHPTFVELEGDGRTVRIKGAHQPYALTWDDRKSAISCQTPEGKVQVFARVR